MTAARFLRPAERGEPAVRLLHALPDWQRAVPAEELSLASRALVARKVTVCDGVFDPMTAAAPPAGARLAIVIGGVLFRNTSLHGRVVTEVVGEGDVIDVVDEIEPSMLAATTEYVVHRPATIALLGDRFRAATRRWPVFSDLVGEQLARQRRRTSAHLAILQLPRVEDRIAAMFTLVADRWGRVGGDGVRLDLPLTHEVIGHIVGARRPTVTLALAALAASGEVVRRADGSWLLHRAVPAAASAPEAQLSARWK